MDRPVTRRDVAVAGLAIIACLVFTAARITGDEVSHGLLSIDTGVANAPASGTAELVSSSWVVESVSGDWSGTVAGRLTYTGTETPRTVGMDFSSGINSDAQAVGDVISLFFAKNGTKVEGSEADFVGLAGGTHHAVPLAWSDATVTTGDYFEVFVTIDAGGGPEIIVDHGCFRVWGGR